MLTLYGLFTMVSLTIYLDTAVFIICQLGTRTAYYTSTINWFAGLNWDLCFTDLAN